MTESFPTADKSYLMDRTLIFLVSMILTLTACSTSTKRTVIVEKTTDEASIQLAEAADSVSQSLNELAAIERATAIAPYKARLVEPSLMGNTVSIDWSGPVEPLLRRIAVMSGYRLRVLGPQPPIPVIITLTAKDTPVGDIVRDIDFQCNKKAKVYVYPHGRVIELRYFG